MIAEDPPASCLGQEEAWTIREWEEIEIIGRDKEKSTDQGTPSGDGLQLGLQVFRLSHPTPEDRRAIFKGIFIAEPGRLGREAEATSMTIPLWGGPYIFDERDVERLKGLVEFTNSQFGEQFAPAGDLSGFDAFGEYRRRFTWKEQAYR